MANYIGNTEEEKYIGTSERNYEVEAAQKTLLKNVYLWMALALVVTGLTSFYVASTPSIVATIFSSKAIFYGLIFGELALVLILSAAINKISFPVAGIMFVAYSILNGLTLSSLLLIYTMESVASTFFITAGTFGAMALYGHITNKDLSKIGSILMMALIGLIIASLVNLFLGNSTLSLIISYVGVLIFVGLTAYDAQKIKNMITMYGTDTSDTNMKMALMGSLELYLDFINLFIYLLRILGKRNN